MEPEIAGFWAAIGLGLLLGLRHATDADHVVAVATIVSERHSALRSVWIGASWGLGHTTPLLVLGTAILIVRDRLMTWYESAAPVLEFGVGVMLVVLGANVLWRLARNRLHVHEHLDAPKPHVHVHAHDETGETVQGARGQHGPPFHSHFAARNFRPKSYIVGMVHGLAGSAAVMLLLLPQAPSVAVGVTYLALFGVGTVLSMAGITLVLSVPFAVTAGVRGAGRWVVGVAGAGSLAFGVALMSDLAAGTHLLAFLPE